MDAPTRHIDAFRLTKPDHSFVIEAMVVLPDHLHCLWRLPPGDNDLPMRWRLVKARFLACPRMANAFPRVGCARANEASGSDGIGSM